MENGIHNAYVAINRDGNESLHPAGRLLVHDNKINHLEDYHGLLAQEIPKGPVDDYTLLKLSRPGGGLRIASESAIRSGHRLDLLPEADLQPMPPPVKVQPGQIQQHLQRPQFPSAWHYSRAGHDQPHVLEARDGKILLDGNPLKDEESSLVLDNIRTGVGKIRYMKNGLKSRVAKMERIFSFMAKADMDPQEALAHLDSVNGDDRTRAAIASLRRHVFEDPMNPGVGNKFAYEDFRAKAPPGVWTSMDVNDLKHLNDTQGHSAGDSLIRGFGAAARKAVDPDGGKLFRAGGDEYVMWHPTPEAAYTALRNIRHHVDQVPPINGTHKISFSAGLGSDFEGADKALYQAKARKMGPGGVRAHAPGQVPHLAHSSLPGSEGPVPLDPHETQVHAPDMGPPKLVSVLPSPKAA